MTGLQLQQEDKIDFIERLASAIVKSRSREDLERAAWDTTYTELLGKDWEDVLDFAEEFGLSYSRQT